MALEGSYWLVLVPFLWSSHHSAFPQLWPTLTSTWPPPQFLCRQPSVQNLSPDCAEAVLGHGLWKCPACPCTIFPSACILGFPCQGPAPPVSPSQPGFSQPRSPCAHGHRPRAGRVGKPIGWVFFCWPWDSASLMGSHFPWAVSLMQAGVPFPRSSLECPWPCSGSPGRSSLQRWPAPPAPPHTQPSLRAHKLPGKRGVLCCHRMEIKCL